MHKDHFKQGVPLQVQAKLLELAELVHDDFISDQTNESYEARDIVVIQGNSYDGYIAFQDGGYEVNELYPSDQDESYHITKAQTVCMQEQYDSMLEDFKHDYDLDSTDIPDALYDALSEYVIDYFQPALFKVVMYCVEGVVRISVHLNYKDPLY